MLKKLSKYGNSTTLVIDRAILELLNMDESSIVKLQTDGKSLIITPVVAADKDKNISYTPEEGMRLAIAKQLEKNAGNHAHLEKRMPEMQQDFKIAFENHKKAMEKSKEKFASKEFQDALAELAQKYDPATQSEDYLKELETLKVQFVPEIAELNKELAAITEKYKNQI